MKNCQICGKPIKKEGRTVHLGCRMIKRVSKKIPQGFDMNSQHFEQACKAMDNNPNLLFKQFQNEEKRLFHIEGILYDNLPMNKSVLDLVFFIMSGGEIPPIKLIKTENGYKLSDGRHRLAALKLLVHKVILARYYKPIKE